MSDLRLTRDAPMRYRWIVAALPPRYSFILNQHADVRVSKCVSSGAGRLNVAESKPALQPARLKPFHGMGTS
jgi:hypothetical protein